MYKILFIIFLSVALVSCTEDEIVPTVSCIEAEVIGKIRTAGGGFAVSLSEPLPGAVTWQGKENVVEVLNMPVDFTFPGKVIYFQAREAKEGERGPISTDGDENINLILYGSQFSDIGCQEVR